MNECLSLERGGDETVLNERIITYKCRNRYLISFPEIISLISFPNILYQSSGFESFVSNFKSSDTKPLSVTLSLSKAKLDYLELSLTQR